MYVIQNVQDRVDQSDQEINVYVRKFFKLLLMIDIDEIKI